MKAKLRALVLACEAKDYYKAVLMCAVIESECRGLLGRKYTKAPRTRRPKKPPTLKLLECKALGE